MNKGNGTSRRCSDPFNGHVPPATEGRLRLRGLAEGPVGVAEPDQCARQIQPRDSDVPHLPVAFLRVCYRGEHLRAVPEITLLRSRPQGDTRLGNTPLSGAQVLVQSGKGVLLAFRIDSR